MPAVPVCPRKQIFAFAAGTPAHGCRHSHGYASRHAWVLNASKAWVRGSWLYIALTIATQIALIPNTDFSNVSQVLIFNLISTVPYLLQNMGLSYLGFRKLRPARS